MTVTHPLSPPYLEEIAMGLGASANFEAPSLRFLPHRVAITDDDPANLEVDCLAVPISAPSSS